MIVAGVNYSIDSAAALICHGRRVAASMEERFTRLKHDRSFPSQALRFCLSYAGLSSRDVDTYAFFWNPGRHLEPMLTRQSAGLRHHAEFLYSYPNYVLQTLGQPSVGAVEQILHLEDTARPLHCYYVDHHMAHAAGAFFNSPFDEAAILTVDGYGERTASLVAHGAGTSIRRVLSQDFPHSVGALYAAVSQFLGFKPNSGEGKVMGLASYGDDSLVPDMRSLVRLTEDGFELDLSYFQFNMERTVRYTPKFQEKFGAPRAPESAIEPRHENVATALQKVTEELMLHLAGIARKKTGAANLCIAGGVALNCVANSRIQFEAGFERLFILPPSGDAGASLGSAQYVAHVVTLPSTWTTSGLKTVQRRSRGWWKPRDCLTGDPAGSRKRLLPCWQKGRSWDGSRADPSSAQGHWGIALSWQTRDAGP